jgi:hypothetical protein
MAKFYGINCGMEVVVIGYRRGVVVRDERGTPNAEKLVDSVVRERRNSIEYIGEFESST